MKESSGNFQIPMEILDKASTRLGGSFADSAADVDFFSRTFGDGNLEKYLERLSLIGFEGLGKILDLGCGFGQWTFSLSLKNGSISGVDIDARRIDLANLIREELNFTDVNFEVVDTVPLLTKFGANSFDGVFAYIAIPYMPWRDSLKDIASILRMDGLLYFTAYDLGWPCFNLVENHNPSKNFDPQKWAMETIENTVEYERTGKFNSSSSKSSVYIPQRELLEYLPTIGFELISCAGDGLTDITGNQRNRAFYNSHYKGFINVYEVLARKRSPN
jgi:SAM-dependent methyltransferase